MYIRENRSIANVYGMREVGVDENPFSNPCILTSFPFGGTRNVNGYFSKILDLLGLKHGNKINSGIDIEQIPFSLLNDRLGKETVDKILLLIPEKDNDKAKEILKNITIFSYCNGHDNTYSLIMGIHDGLVNKGYSEDDIKDIMSQIVVLQVVANFSKGVFPYVTSIIFHDIYDLENTSWLELPQEAFPTDSFSKILINQAGENCFSILNSSFGEDSLKANFPAEHVFSNDYYGAPVLSALMSICFINSLSRSIDKKNINVQDILESSSEILSMAKEYEDKHKDLDSLSKEDIQEFKEIFTQKIYDYLNTKIPTKKRDSREIELENERTEVIEILKSKGLYRISIVYEISATINKILEYYRNFDKEEVVDIRIGNSGYVPYVVGEFIKEEIVKLNKYIKELGEFLNSIVLPDTVSVEIRKELEEYKYSILANLLTGEVRDIIREYELSEVLDNEVNVGMKL